MSASGDIVKQIEYINLLIKRYGKNVDKNVYYELVYAKTLFEAELTRGIDDEVLRESCQSSLDSLNLFLDTLDLEDVQEHEIIDIRPLDNRKYLSNTVFNGNTYVEDVAMGSYVDAFGTDASKFLLFMVFTVIGNFIPTFPLSLLSYILASYMGISFALDLAYISIPSFRNKLLNSKLIDRNVQKACMDYVKIYECLNDKDRFRRNFQIAVEYSKDIPELIDLIDRFTMSNDFKEKVLIVSKIELKVDSYLYDGLIEVHSEHE